MTWENFWLPLVRNFVSTRSKLLYYYCPLYLNWPDIYFDQSWLSSIIMGYHRCIAKEKLSNKRKCKKNWIFSSLFHQFNVFHTRCATRKKFIKFSSIKLNVGENFRTRWTVLLAVTLSANFYKIFSDFGTDMVSIKFF